MKVYTTFTFLHALLAMAKGMWGTSTGIDTTMSAKVTGYRLPSLLLLLLPLLLNRSPNLDRVLLAFAASVLPATSRHDTASRTRSPGRRCVNVFAVSF